MGNITDILGDEGYVVRTFSNPSEIFKFLEEVRGGEGGSVEDEDPAMKLAEDMTSKQAMTFAIAAQIGAGRECADGHAKCGQFNMEAASVWLAIHENLVAQEAREAQMADAPEQPEPEDANLGLATTRKLLEELEARFNITTPNEEARNDIRAMLHQMTNETLEYREVSSSGSETGQVS